MSENENYILAVWNTQDILRKAGKYPIEAVVRRRTKFQRCISKHAAGRQYKSNRNQRKQGH